MPFQFGTKPSNSEFSHETEPQKKAIIAKNKQKVFVLNICEENVTRQTSWKCWLGEKPCNFGNWAIWAFDISVSIKKAPAVEEPKSSPGFWLPTSVSGELIDSQDELNKNRNQILKPELRAGCAPLKNSLVQPLEATCFLRAGNVSKLLMAGRPWMNTEITLLKSVELFQFLPLKIWSLKFKTEF